MHAGRQIKNRMNRARYKKSNFVRNSLTFVYEVMHCKEIFDFLAQNKHASEQTPVRLNEDSVWKYLLNIECHHLGDCGQQQKRAMFLSCSNKSFLIRNCSLLSPKLLLYRIVSHLMHWFDVLHWSHNYRLYIVDDNRVYYPEYTDGSISATIQKNPTSSWLYFFLLKHRRQRLPLKICVRQVIKIQEIFPRMKGQGRSDGKERFCLSACSTFQKSHVR